MNYRHAFHAGNFADLVKHAALLQLLARIARPATVIDTHAGRGLYDLAGLEAQKSGEAAQGVLRLIEAKDAPPAFEPLIASVKALNDPSALRRYPGSPWLIAQALRPRDRYIACELRAEEHAALSRTLKGRQGVETLCADGYEVAAARCPSHGPALILIDPPFERADDYVRIVDTVEAVRRRNRAAMVLAWLPLKDLDTFDRFLTDLEDVAEGALIAETRMRPLSDPLKMNGCALALVGGPGDEVLDDMAPILEAVCGWTAATLGDHGKAYVRRL